MNTHVYSRQSVLNDRHRQPGTKFESSWNDMPIPQLYATDAYVETEAVRNRAGLLDVTSLRMIGVSGKDALAALNEMLISDISKIKPGASSISNIVDDNGSLIDDVLIYCDGPNAYRTSHGGGALEDALPNISAGRDVHLHKDNGTHIVSLQGPKALDILAPNTPLNWPICATLSMEELHYSVATFRSRGGLLRRAGLRGVLQGGGRCLSLGFASSKRESISAKWGVSGPAESCAFKAAFVFSVRHA